MIDHLITAPDEATLIATLPQYRLPADNESPERWGHASGRVDFIRDVALIRAKATYDEAGEIVTPEDRVGGFTLSIGRQDADMSLATLGLPFIIADRDAARRGEPFIVATNYAPEQIAGIVAVEPTWAGSAYPFGGA